MHVRLGGPFRISAPAGLRDDTEDGFALAEDTDSDARAIVPFAAGNDETLMTDLEQGTSFR